MTARAASGGLTTLVQTVSSDRAVPGFRQYSELAGHNPPSEALHCLDDLLVWCASARMQDRPDHRTARRLVARGSSGAARKPLPRRSDCAKRSTAFSGWWRIRRGASDDWTGSILRWLRRRRGRVKRRWMAMSGKSGRPGRRSPALLAPVLWSAGDLLTWPQLQRVRQCANDKCLWLFLDDSKSGESTLVLDEHRAAIAPRSTAII